MQATSASETITTDGKEQRSRRYPVLLVFAITVAAVLATHWSLLRLPYFWDEGGYYVPAALDFYRTGTLIPIFTNAHPPLPNIVLGTLWHLFGFHVFVTRVTACFFAALGLTAVFSLGLAFLEPGAALSLTFLTGIYPIWFAQSSLAHADVFSAAFSLAALAVFLPATDLIGSSAQTLSQNHRRIALCSLLFCLSVLSKETAIVQPVTLASIALIRTYRTRSEPFLSNMHRRWAFALLVPVPVLALWYGYHFFKTGQVFGNPVYLHYNATDNFTISHILYALRIRVVHLFWQRELWIPLTLAAACYFLPRRQDFSAGHRSPGQKASGLSRTVFTTIGALVVANLVAFSILGGALLTRYLLPVYPLLLLVCLSLWTARLRHWPWMVLLTAAAFIPALWLNPSTFFAPEDNLTYRNMVVVQQHAITFLNQHYPEAVVLTAWPVSADLTRPELGYTEHRFRITSLENFTAPELQKASQEPGRYDTALVFTTHYTSPAFRRYLLTHPKSWRGRRYAADLDLSPAQIALQLGGDVIWQEDLYGEWAAVLRFHRTYDASLHNDPTPPPAPALRAFGEGSALPSNQASSPSP